MTSSLLREAEAEMRRSFNPCDRPSKKRKVDGEEGSDRNDDDDAFVEVGRYAYAATADLQRPFGIQGGSPPGSLLLNSKH